MLFFDIRCLDNQAEPTHEPSRSKNTILDLLIYQILMHFSFTRSTDGDHSCAEENISPDSPFDGEVDEVSQRSESIRYGRWNKIYR